MMLKLVHRRFVQACMPVVTAVTVVAMTGCGDDDKKDEEGATDGWKAEVFKVTGGSADVDFTGAAADEQYVLMPMSLGDPATVQGGNAENFAFTLATSGGGSLQLHKPKARAPMSLTELDHGKRTLLNRFVAAKGEDQGAWFWQLARELDQQAPGAELTESFGPGEIESTFRAAARRGASRSSFLTTTTTAAACPTAGGKVTMPDVEDPTEPYEETIPAGGVVSADDYCIVYLTEPTTGGTKAEIEASIKTVISRYKDVIYKDTFAAVGSYTFKPVFVIADFGDTDLWPAAKAYQVVGAFLPDMSTAANMPMLYMSSDTQKVGAFKSAANYDAAKVKKQWHGTIAHEMQHAIINYYRTRVSAGGSEEMAALDEGIAHYMEDVFGYGPENFGSFAFAFLQSWTNNTPALNAANTEDVSRGGAQTLLYYLTSQKGGLEFTDGVVSGGGGLDYLVALVKNAGGKQGPANLSAKFGGDWLTTIADFYGALTLDGGTATIDSTLKAQDPQTISDLNGSTDKTFGMHFNGFGGLDPQQDFSGATTADTTEVEVTFYATAPVLYTVKDAAAKVKFTTEQDAANTAVVKVRVK